MPLRFQDAYGRVADMILFSGMWHLKDAYCRVKARGFGMISLNGGWFSPALLPVPSSADSLRTWLFGVQLVVGGRERVPIAGKRHCSVRYPKTKI